MDLTQLDDLQLIEEFEQILKEASVYSKPMALLTNLAGISYNNLSKALDKYFPGKGDQIFNKLLMGQGKITSAEHGYRLIELAVMVKMDKETLQFFTANTLNVLDWEKELPNNSPFKRAFAEFLKEYGHRGIYEGDISNPRWSEDPSYLLNYIQSILGKTDFKEMKSVQLENSQKAWKEIMSKIPYYNRGIIKWLVKKAVKSLERREMAKSQLVRIAKPGRLIGLEIGRRFVQKGLLDNENDTFHCSWSEAISILRGDWDGSGLKATINYRKDKMEKDRKLDSPDTIIDGVPQENTALETEISGDFLKGLGVAMGRSEGLVKVISHPNEGGNLKFGEILVAPTTDPAWTPLFLKASAIVMETGGFLSQSAIVSREYGIPAVVNVAGVMKKLKNGDPIIVDGDEGRVYLLSGKPSKT